MATLATSMRRGPEGLFDTAQQIGRRRRLLPGPHPSCSVTGAGNSLLELVLSVVVLLALIASRLLLLLLSLFLLRQHVRLNGELYVLQLLLGTLLPFLRAELTFLDVAGTALGQMSSPPSVVRHTVLFTVCRAAHRAIRRDNCPGLDMGHASLPSSARVLENKCERRQKVAIGDDVSVVRHSCA